jgi:hypothetical protein
MSLFRYLVTLPERVVRAGAAVVGGAGYEASKVIIPERLRRSRLYEATVARLLRITVELVGDVHGVYPREEMAVGELLKRKTAGNVLELASVLAVGWSPLWMLAAASDLIGGTKAYLKALVKELRAAQLLPAEADIDSFGSLLETLQGTSAVLADTLDLPPLDLSSVQTAWTTLQQQVEQLPSPQRLAALFGTLQDAANQEQRSLLEVSSLVALGAVRAGIQLGNAYLFEYYRVALLQIAREGIVPFLKRISHPYLLRAGKHFVPSSHTWTEQALKRIRPKND